MNRNASCLLSRFVVVCVTKYLHVYIGEFDFGPVERFKYARLNDDEEQNYLRMTRFKCILDQIQRAYEPRTSLLNDKK